MPKIAITDYTFADLEPEKSILEPLGCTIVERKKFTSEEKLQELVRDADYVINQFAPLTAAVIQSMAKCRLIVRYGIGVDNVDVDAAAKQGIPVCNIPDYCVDEVADHTLAFVLALTRKVVPGWDVVRAGEWKLAVPPEQMQERQQSAVPPEQVRERRQSAVPPEQVRERRQSAAPPEQVRLQEALAVDLHS